MNVAHTTSSFTARTNDVHINAYKMKHLEFRNLEFYSGTMNVAHTTNVVIENCKFMYPHHSKRVLRDTSPPITLVADNSKNFNFRNNVMRFSDGKALSVRFVDRLRIGNNEFFQIDYAAVDDNSDGAITIDARASTDVVYRFNTLDTAGSSDNVRYVRAGGPPAGPDAQFYMNFHTNCGWSQHDGATIQIGTGTSAWNTLIHHNWFVNTAKNGMRFDGGPGQSGSCGVVYRNVAYNAAMYHGGFSGFRTKGDFHKVFNNLAVHSGNDLTLKTDKGPKQNGRQITKFYSNFHSNLHTQAANNAAHHGDINHTLA